MTLVENLDIDNVECLKYAVSKALGIGIVVGGSIMKVPQLLLSVFHFFIPPKASSDHCRTVVVSARSARGLSLPAYVLETLAYAITLAYSYRNGFPFSTYGENLFLTIQNILITFLIIYYPSSRLTRAPSTSSQLAVATIATGATGFALCFVPSSTLAFLQAATIPISLFSKLPQIRQNSRARSTGQLSAFAVVSQIVGCLARLFTTAAEVGDLIMAAGFALALVLNVVLGVQMWAYWGKDVREEPAEGVPMTIIAPTPEKPSTPPIWQQQQHQFDEEPIEVIVPPQSPRGIRAGSPQIRHSSGRKWARKVE